MFTPKVIKVELRGVQRTPIDVSQWLVVSSPFHGELVNRLRNAGLLWENARREWQMRLREPSGDYHPSVQRAHAALTMLFGELMLFQKAHASNGWTLDVSTEVRDMWAQLRVNLTASQAAQVPVKADLKAAKLFDFQTAGVRFWMENGCRGMLAWEQGCGKTLGAVAAMETVTPNGRVVVFTPEHLRPSWLRALRTQTDRPVFVYGATKYASNDWLKTTNGVILIGYASAEKVSHALGTPHASFTMLVADECQALKNRKAIRTKAMRTIARRVERALFLSGTPLLNRPEELFPVLRMIDPARFTNFMSYAHQFCAAKHNGFGWDTSGASNLDTLHKLLTGTYMHRVLKTDVLELPAKQRITVPLSIDNEREYSALRDKVQGTFHSVVVGDKVVNRMDALSQMNQLRQCAVTGKLRACCDWIADWQDAHPDEALVVFVNHKAVAYELARLLTDSRKPVCLTGDMSEAQRDLTVTTFVAGQYRVLISTLAVGSTGLTLTNASTVAFVESGWTPGEMLQAEDRVHRIGQTSESVTIYYLMAADTVDELIIETICQKAGVISAVLDGRDSEQAKQSVFDSVLADLTSATKVAA